MKKTITTIILVLVSFVVYGQRTQKFEDGIYAEPAPRQKTVRYSYPNERYYTLLKEKEAELEKLFAEDNKLTRERNNVMKDGAVAFPFPEVIQVGEFTYERCLEPERGFADYYLVNDEDYDVNIIKSREVCNAIEDKVLRMYPECDIVVVGLYDIKDMQIRCIVSEIAYSKKLSTEKGRILESLK